MKFKSGFVEEKLFTDDNLYLDDFLLMMKINDK